MRRMLLAGLLAPVLFVAAAPVSTISQVLGWTPWGFALPSGAELRLSDILPNRDHRYYALVGFGALMTVTYWLRLRHGVLGRVFRSRFGMAPLATIIAGLWRLLRGMPSRRHRLAVRSRLPQRPLPRPPSPHRPRPSM